MEASRTASADFTGIDDHDAKSGQEIRCLKKKRLLLPFAECTFTFKNVKSLKKEYAKFWFGINHELSSLNSLLLFNYKQLQFIHVQIFISLSASTEFSIDSIIQLIILCTVRTYRETVHYLAVVFCCQLILIHWWQVFNRSFLYYISKCSLHQKIL